MPGAARTHARYARHDLPCSTGRAAGAGKAVSGISGSLYHFSTSPGIFAASLRGL